MTACHMRLSEAATAVAAQLRGNDGEFDGVSTDSRSVQPGQLFVALKGPNFDAHHFVPQVAAAGASAVMVQHETDTSLPQLIVPDTLRALGQLGHYWRQRFAMPVAAVTGSNGKTTVKEMLASIFASQWYTLATRGNLNNDIGVPLTLLQLTEQHQAAVIEMGANHPGEIAYLTGLTRPTVALITNAGAAHLEGFGSIAGVAQAKGEIYQGLTDDGVAIINADDDYADLWRQLAGGHRTITFGLDQAADVSCRWRGDAQGSQLVISIPQGELECHLALAGRHNVMNALAAAAAALAAGLGPGHIKRGLENVRPVSGRLQLKSGIKGSSIIDDTYNANPYSLQAALKVLAACEGEKFLALGDMGELGGDAAELHRQAGEQARDYGVDALYAVGEFSRNAVQAFGERAHHFAEQAALIDSLRDDMHADVTLLVKGSRAMHMERVVDALSNEMRGA
jgi:UDP-N-acetylmuramoyl-tripeptide--D-alanyl-D-alanine ligase